MAYKYKYNYSTLLWQMVLIFFRAEEKITCYRVLQPDK